MPTPAAVRWTLALIAGAAAPAALPPAAHAAGDGAAADGAAALEPAAAALRFRYGGRKVKGADVEQELSPLVREALNDWAAVADDLDLPIHVSRAGEHLVLGRASERDLERALDVMDRTAALLAPVLPEQGRGRQRAAVALLFDAKGLRSEAWTGVLAALAAREILVPEAVAGLTDDPNGVFVRNRSLFLQPTVDLAGSAAQGDDEFRLDNEVANKLAQCLLEGRCGPLPPIVRWGVGYLAEQALFDTVYMFDVAGFVSSSDHFDWARKTRRILADEPDVPLSERFLDDGVAGRHEPGQLVAWGCLEHLRARDPQRLAALLADLAAAHAAADRWGVASHYQGGARATREILERHLGELSPHAVAESLGAKD